MSEVIKASDNFTEVVYIITSLAMGGAQKVLLGLLANQQLKAKPPLVVSLLKTEGLQQAFAEIGAEVFYLELEKPQLIFKKIFQLRQLLAERQIKILYSFLHHANLFALFMAKLSSKPHPMVIWGLHDTPLKGLYTRWQHRLLFSLTVRLAHFPHKVILVSERSQQRYLEVGYLAKNMQLIPNGVLVQPVDPEQTKLARQTVRAELGLGVDALLIGSLTRSVPEKDLPLMLTAFAQLVTKQSVYLVLVGEGVDAKNTELQAQITSLGLDDRVYTLGVRQDAARLIRAFDIATLSSRSEALPLFLVEAMALGIPCVATDVGDIGLVLGEQGELIAAGDSEALATAWQKVLSYSSAEKQLKIQAAWQHIQMNFSRERMQQQHLALFSELLQSCEANQAWNMRMHHKRC